MKKEKGKKEKKKTGHMINNGEFLIPEPPGAKAEERLFYLVNRKRSHSLICRGCACRSSRGKTGS